MADHNLLKLTQHEGPTLFPGGYVEHLGVEEFDPATHTETHDRESQREVERKVLREGSVLFKSIMKLRDGGIYGDSN